MNDQNHINNEGLIGRYFHQLDLANEIGWQGVVVGTPCEGFYLVQLLSWIDGKPTFSKIINIKEMQLWQFYLDAEEMDYNYKKHIQIFKKGTEE